MRFKIFFQRVIYLLLLGAISLPAMQAQDEVVKVNPKIDYA